MVFSIRKEKPGDIDSIRTIVEAAFKGHPYSQGAEHLIVDGLREQGALTLSLVAEQNGEMAGHIAFSPVLIQSQFNDWYGIGPLSVAPSQQRQGIGSALMREGLTQIKNNRNVQGIVILGDPGYYQKFGFATHKDMILPGVPAEHFMVQSFTGKISPGTVSFHDAFNIKP